MGEANLTSTNVTTALNTILHEVTGAIFPWSYSEVLKILGVAAAIALTVVIASGIKLIMRKLVSSKLPRHIYVPIERVIFYSIIAIGVTAALSPLGIDLTGLLVAGGVTGVVVGFAAQTVVANALSGIFLHIDRPLKLGDPVQVENVSGHVVDISIFSTRIKTWDGNIVRIPNDKLFSSLITNYTASVARRIEFKIGISYSSDIGKAKEAILKVLNDHPLVLVNPPPEVFVEDFGDSAIVLAARCWAPAQLWFATKKQLLELIKKAFDEVGVEIPFPQLDLHVKEGVKIVIKREKQEMAASTT